jgi:predicted dehydrogenase
MIKSLLSDRRKFIKKSGLIAGAIMAAPSIASCINSSQQKLGVALVGLGNYSTQMLGPALKETGNCYLSGIVTGTPDKATKWAAEHQLKQQNIYNYDNYDDIKNNPDIDIIYVVLPNSMHAEFSIRALEAGKHVICEKPMALTAEEGKEMIAVARKMKRKLAIGYRMHYDPYFIEAKRLGQEEVFGPVNYMECALGYSSTPNLNSWQVKKSMGGGPLYNLGVYPIQSARHTKGSEPVYVTAQATIKRKHLYPEVDEIVTWQLEFADGTLCNSYSGDAGWLDQLRAVCTDGFIELNPATAYNGQVGKSTNGPMEYPQVFQQKLQIEDFARCVMENEESMVSGIDGLKDMFIIDAIYESIRTGQKAPVEKI